MAIKTYLYDLTNDRIVNSSNIEIDSLWTPAEITTELWFDASDSSTITLDGSDKVEQWNDKSGNGLHLTQANASYRPSVSTEAKNGLDVISFDGSNDYLSVVSGSEIEAADVYIVLNYTGTTSTGIPLGIAAGASGVSDYIGVPSGDPANLYSCYKGLITYTARGNISAGYHILNRRPINNASIDNYIDSKLTSFTTSYSYSDENYDRLFVGSRRQLNSFFSSVICEIVILPSNASSYDRQKIEGYLAHKWGLESALLDSHPYKMFAPIAPVDITFELADNNSTPIGFSDALVDDFSAAEFELGSGTDVSIRNNAVFLAGTSDTNALRFDGLNDSVNCGASSLLSADFTIEIKLKYDSNNTQYARVISKLIDADNGYNIAFEDGNASSSAINARFLIEGVSYFFRAVSEISRDTWYHIAVTLSGGSLVTVYIDGDPIDTVDMDGSGSVQGDANLRIGSANSQSYYGGDIGYVRIWNVARNQSQLNAYKDLHIDGSTPGLLGCWDFTEGSGTTAADSTDNSNDGTISGASWVTASETIMELFEGFSATGNIVSGSASVSAYTTTEPDLKIAWQSTEPTDTSITIETGTSDSDATPPATWYGQTSGASITDLPADLTGKYLWYKATLETTDTDATPELEWVVIWDDADSPDAAVRVECDGEVSAAVPDTGTVDFTVLANDTHAYTAYLLPLGAEYTTTSESDSVTVVESNVTETVVFTLVGGAAIPIRLFQRPFHHLLVR